MRDEGPPLAACRCPLAIVNAVPLALVCLFAGVLAWRRLAGGLQSPLDWPALLVVGGATALAAAGTRWAWRGRETGPRDVSSDWVAGVALSASLVALGLAVSLPETPPAGLVAFWGILIAEEAWAWGRHASGRLKAPPGEACRGEIVQRLVRTRLPDGSESLDGWVRASLAAGQRTASVHVAFCPAFAGPPEVTVEQSEGPQARITPVQTLPYGARFDLKLAEPCDEPCEVLLNFTARRGPFSSAIMGVRRPQTARPAAGP